MAFVTPAATQAGRTMRQRAIARNVGFLPEPSVLVENILSCYDIAVEHGARSWYQEANEHARALAHDTGHSPRTVLGVIAALSPATDWERNLRLARTMLETGDCAHAYGDCIRKARQIRDGADPYDVLGGRKVRSFFRNLLHPTTAGAVTIDRHALSIALGGRDTSTRTRTLAADQLKMLDRPGVYQIVAACYRSAARQRGIAPHDLQSITWDYWRDLHAYGTTANVERF